jgi:hypothetical protein
MLIAVKEKESIFYGSITKVAKYINVHRLTIARWIKSGDRIVYKNGFEIYLNIEKL